MSPTLRPYQHEAIQAVIAERKAGTRRMVVCLPTGSGKTVIFAELARMARRQVLVLAHREELLQQAQAKLQAALGPDAIVSIERAEEQADENAQVIVCSIRSLHEKRLANVIAGRDIGLVLYDECHHAVAEDNRRVLEQLGCFKDDWTGTLLGFTATTQRGDGLPLHDVFEKIVYTRTLPSMVEDGWLVPLKGFRIATEADLTHLSSTGLDFRDDELAEAVDIEERNALVARAIQELARDRRTVAFCVTVNHARHLSIALNRLGVSAGLVHGEMKSDARRKVLADFRAGRIRVLTNVGVLTEGFDDPGVSCIAMARPTRSDGLYAQCVGRGTRLAPGKKDCLVLDFVDLSSLSLVTLPTLFGLPKDFDLEGRDATEAAACWNRIRMDIPGFELEAGAITLQEIQERAAHFDPLTLEINPEVRAISRLAWKSLGRPGLVLHYEPKPGKTREVLIIDQRTRGKRWLVTVDGKERARFSLVEDAVQAVDWEVDQAGPRAWATALPEADWRRRPAGAGRTAAQSLQLSAFNAQHPPKRA